ncbi:3-dehydroquinate synthase [Leptospira noguchii]|uniref:3-dehydroquinate synthase n=1 Tax=Leptospira noguchii TaxID=28182 RepID=UPI001F065058|nr:3-dehydroquinate synthase [Leptospira noguchii]MCH1917656.1 3-dehydroquinate synthase [Leptospira noguchii]UOG65728.1 3-dehydroquinate synthase [Leptospira noguchii]
MSLIETIPVNTEHKSVPVHLHSDLSGLSEEIAKLPGITSVFLITERSIHSIYSKYLERELSSFPIKTIYIKGGEKSKHINRTGEVYNQLIEYGADRKSLILAFGGGIVGDFAGFIASTYLRGIRFVQIPTTLLACVDSSVGGKVAVNADFGKNMIGSFYQPEFVFAPLSVLSTLSDREWRCGQAEVIKHSLLSGGEYWEKVKAHSFKDLNVNSTILPYLIAESVRFKANVVSNDEKETGLRKILNLGHTTAHAIESVTKYKKYSHGEAVAIGLVTALLLSERYSGLDSVTTKETIESLKRYGLPFQTKLKSKQLAKHMLHDKKNVGGSIRFVLLKSPGSPVFDITVDSEDIILAIHKQKGIQWNL